MKSFKRLRRLLAEAELVVDVLDVGAQYRKALRFAPRDERAERVGERRVRDREVVGFVGGRVPARGHIRAHQRGRGDRRLA